MDVIFTAEARKQIAGLPKADAARIRAALRQVADAHPQRLSFVTELVGEADTWRLRKGDWRAVYIIRDGALTVVRVAKRSEVYR